MGFVTISIFGVISATFIFLFTPPSFYWKYSHARVLHKYSSMIKNEHLVGRISKKYHGLPAPEAIILFDKPESFVFGYAGAPDGWLAELYDDGTFKNVAYLNGYAIGGDVEKSGRGLFIAVAPIGLLHVDLSSFEITVAAAISDDNLPIRFPADARVSSDGKVYFNCASQVAPDVNKEGVYDLEYVVAKDASSGSGTGRFLVYDTRTRKTKTLLSGLMFANGIAISADESFALISESFAFRIIKYYLTGSRAGTYEYLVERLPGTPDNISLAPDGNFWVAIFSPMDDGVASILSNKWVGFIYSHLKRGVAPPLPPYTTIIKIDSDGNELANLQDPKGTVLYCVTSVVEYEGYLYLADSRDDFVAVVKVEKIRHLIKI